MADSFRLPSQSLSEPEEFVQGARAKRLLESPSSVPTTPTDMDLSSSPSEEPPKGSEDEDETAPGSEEEEEEDDDDEEEEEEDQEEEEEEDDVGYHADIEDEPLVKRRKVSARDVTGPSSSTSYCYAIISSSQHHRRHAILSSSKHCQSILFFHCCRFILF
jgi:hypothetical protein